MTVGRICTREVFLASPNESVAAASRRMLDENVGTLVVLDPSRQPIGLVTDRDLVRRVLAVGKDPDKTRVAEVMTEGPRFAHEGMPIEQALQLMRAGNHRRMPVVDSYGKLAGILSLADVLVLLASEFADVGRLLDVRAPRQRRA